jgi:hypothetical protein
MLRLIWHIGGINEHVNCYYGINHDYMCDLEAKFVATFLYIVEVEELNHSESELEEFETFGKNNKMLLLGACEGGGKSFKMFFQCLAQ